MIVIGLTGSIGMGKSVLAEQFRSQGIAVHEADKTVHDLMSPGGAAEIRLRDIFPDAVENGVIDRKKLGAIVYADKDAREKLESVLHPLVREDRKSWLDDMRTQGRDMAVIDVPLLFETGLDSWCDYIVCVTAPVDVQRERVLARTGMTPERLAAILELQMPDADKRRKSDLVVDTSHGYDATLDDIKKLLESARAKTLKLRHA